MQLFIALLFAYIIFHHYLNQCYPLSTSFFMHVEVSNSVLVFVQCVAICSVQFSTSKSIYSLTVCSCLMMILPYSTIQHFTLCLIMMHHHCITLYDITIHNNALSYIKLHHIIFCHIKMHYVIYAISQSTMLY